MQVIEKIVEKIVEVPVKEQVKESSDQLSFFEAQEAVPALTQEEQEALNKLRSLNVSGTTPMDALQLVYQLQQTLLK